MTVGLDGMERLSRQEMIQRIADEFARWGNREGDVLPPWSSLRLRVTTTVDVRAHSPLNSGFSGTRSLTQCAYFRTQGPPGLAAYDLPQNHPLSLAPPSGGTSAPAFKSGLEDLTTYVRQTIPPTVPAAGDKPLMPRPVYRGYDVGVLFNETYVDLMYALAARDLTLYIFDNNDAPARDEQGFLIARNNRWARQEELTLTRSEERWVEHFDLVSCRPLDPVVITRDIQVASGGHVLPPETAHSARLVPLLLHEMFAGYTLGVETIGPAGNLSNALTGGWTVRDDEMVGPYSRWVVEQIVQQEDAPPARYIVQKNNIATGGTWRTSLYPGGALLLKAGNPHLDAAHPDQPNNWTDYRASVFVRSDDDDPIGLSVRTRGRSGYLFYLDRQYNRRRLVRMSQSGATLLAESAGGYHSGIDYHISFEAIGGRLRVFVDGVLAAEATDTQYSAGSVALYCGENQGARFTDVRVDDLRRAAPAAYRFEFTTSRFTDFRHHLHSYPDATFRVDLADLNGVAAAFAAAIELTATAAAAQPSEAEARAFEQLALKALGPASAQDPAAVDVTRIDRGNQPLAYLVRTGEPIDWRRTSLEVFRAAAHNRKPERPSGPKLIEAGFASTNANDESVAVILGEAADLSGWRIEYRHLPGAAPPNMADGEALFQTTTEFLTKEFIDSSTWNPLLVSASEISVVNGKGTGTPAWTVRNGEVSQTGNFFIAEAPGANPPLRLGAHALLADNFVNFRYLAQIRANALGRLGLLFRYQDEQNYYRISVDDKGVIELLKYRNKNGAVLASSNMGQYPIGVYGALMVEATDNRIVVYQNNQKIFDVLDPDLIEGRLGFYTHGRPDARFTEVFVTRLAPRLGPWRLYERPSMRSMWTSSAAVMRQTVDLSVNAPPATELVSEGSIALVGDGSWTDVRIESSLAPGPAVIAGYLFRYMDAGNHYRLVFDGVRGRRSLIRVYNGAAAEIWSAAGTAPPGDMTNVRIEAVGYRIRVWLDETLLAERFDVGSLTGSAGVISIDGAPVSWGEFFIKTATPQWEPWREFTAETGRGPGRRYRVFSGLEDDPIPPSTDWGELRRFREKGPAVFRPAFPVHGVDLRLVAPSGLPGHSRRFAPASAYSAISPRFIRAADGAGFILAIPDAAAQAGCRIDPGEYRFRFTFRRNNSESDPESLILSQDGDESPEIVQIDAPWVT